MANWQVEKAVAAARSKLELMMSIKNQMVTTLPSALLELYEMCRLAKVKESLTRLFGCYNQFLLFRFYNVRLLKIVRIF